MTASQTHFPPALTGGESTPRHSVEPVLSQSTTKIDWCTLTFRPSEAETLAWHVIELLRLVMGDVRAEDCPGLMGYANGLKFMASVEGGKKVQLARLDWGGDIHAGRARLDITGTGCSRVASWCHIETWLYEQREARLTRCDLAADFYNGEYDIDTAKGWLEQGLFNAGGRNPRHSTPGDWLSKEPTYGRTLEIGRRENGKMLRVYEKGLQLAPGSGSKWVRFEVEIRNKDREIPFDILTNPDKYFAGAYKCLEQMVRDQPERIRTEQKEGQVCLERAIENARTSYGPLIHVMRTQMSMAEIVQALDRPGVPKRLEKAALAGYFKRKHRFGSSAVALPV